MNRFSSTRIVCLLSLCVFVSALRASAAPVSESEDAEEDYKPKSDQEQDEDKRPMVEEALSSNNNNNNNKRALPYNGALYGKRRLPYNGGLYGKRRAEEPIGQAANVGGHHQRHQVLSRAVPMSGSLYGKRGAVPYNGGLYG